MRLLLAELRKVWGQRIFALCLAVLAAANLFLLYTGTRPGENSAQPAAWRAAARDLAGLDTAAQQAFLNEKLDLVYGVLQIDQILSYQAVGGYVGVDVRQEYADLFAQYEQAYQDKDYQLYTGDLLVEYGFLSQLKAELNTVAGYPQFLEDVQAKAKQLSGISIFNTGKSGYDRANIDKTAAVYAGMGNVSIQYAPQKGLFTALDYQFTDLILLAAMLLVASLLLRQERDSGMLNLLRSMPGGRLHTALAKLGALAVSLLAVLLLLYGVSLVYCGLTFGLGPLGRSIQSVPALMRCTMQITVGQYLVLFLLAKWAGAFVMGLWVMLAALWARRAFAGWCAALALPAAQWLIRQAIPATSRLNVVKYANLASILRTNELLGNYRNLYWFDAPVSLPLVEWLAVILYGSLLAGGFCLLFCRGQLLAAPAFAGLRRKAAKTKATTVLRQEARKLFLLCGAAVVLLAFAGYQTWQTVTTESYIDAEEIYYAWYMKQLAGPYTEATRQKLLELNEEFEPIRRLDAALAAGEITEESYQAQMGAYYGLQQKMGVFQRIQYGNLAYLKEHPRAQLVYESGWQKLFGFSGEGDLQDTLIAGLVSCICFSGLFAFEHAGGMKRVVMATPLGRRVTLRRKLAVGALGAVLVWLFTCLPRFLIVLRDYGLCRPFAPAMSLQDYAAIPAWVSLSDLLVFAVLARLAACLCMMLLMMAFSECVGNTLGAMFLGSLAFCLPPLLALSGLSGLRWVGFYPLFHMAELARRADVWAGLGALVIALGVGFLCINWLNEKWK